MMVWIAIKEISNVSRVFVTFQQEFELSCTNCELHYAISLLEGFKTIKTDVFI